MCGEKVAAIPTITMAIGITPACAGKSRPCDIGHSPCRDHPRVCGEKANGVMDDIHEKGSPPRVRGKGAGSIAKKPQSGITPACAGKSAQLDSADAVALDHPRVCGEKSSLQRWSTWR